MGTHIYLTEVLLELDAVSLYFSIICVNLYIISGAASPRHFEWVPMANIQTAIVGVDTVYIFLYLLQTSSVYLWIGSCLTKTVLQSYKYIFGYPVELPH